MTHLRAQNRRVKSIVSPPGGDRSPIKFGPIARYLTLSIAIHFALALLSAFAPIAPRSGAALDPINIRLAQDRLEQKREPTGRIVQTTPPDAAEADPETGFLSRANRRGVNLGQEKFDKTLRARIAPKKSEPIAPTKLARDRYRPSQAPRQNSSTLISIAIDVEERAKNLEALNRFSPIESKKETPKKSLSKDEQRGAQRERQARRIARAPSSKPDRAATQSKRGLTTAFPSSPDLDATRSSSETDLIEIGSEAIVALSTRRFEYIDYFNQIRRAIDQNWIYPEKAIVDGLKGTVAARFSIARSGELVGIEIIESSNHPDLDQATIEAIESSAPFEPFPDRIDKETLHIVGRFVYKPSFILAR